MDKLVHPPGTQGGANRVDYRHARIDVADKLRFSLAGISSLLQKNDLRLHPHVHHPGKQLRSCGICQATV